MNKAAISAAFAALVLAQTAAAASACPPKPAGHADTVWRAGVLNYCQARWNDPLARKSAPAAAQPGFIEDCLRRCRAQVRTAHRSGATGPLLAAAAAAAAVSGAVAASHASEKPASP